MPCGHQETRRNRYYTIQEEADKTDHTETKRTQGVEAEGSFRLGMQEGELWEGTGQGWGAPPGGTPTGYVRVWSCRWRGQWLLEEGKSDLRIRKNNTSQGKPQEGQIHPGGKRKGGEEGKERTERIYTGEWWDLIYIFVVITLDVGQAGKTVKGLARKMQSPQGSHRCRAPRGATDESLGKKQGLSPEEEPQDGETEADLGVSDRQRWRARVKEKEESRMPLRLLTWMMDKWRTHFLEMCPDQSPSQSSNPSSYQNSNCQTCGLFISH